jgi:DNA-binding transcriptional LysR family regulator
MQILACQTQLHPQKADCADVPSPFARFVLMPALPSFHERYPEIHLDLGVSDRKVNLVGDNVDCVVRGGEITESSLVARKVGDLVLRVYASPSYLVRMGNPHHPHDLEGSEHRIVAYMQASTGRSSPIPLRRGEETFDVRGRYIVAVDDGNAYLEAGLCGLGVLWLPVYMAEAYVNKGELVRLFEDWQMDPMPMYLAFPPNRNVSTKLRIFINWIVELMEKHMPPIAANTNFSTLSR